MNIITLAQNVLVSTDNCVEFLQEKGLIEENPKRRICGDIMKTKIRGPDYIVFRCQKRVNKHEVGLTTNALKYSNLFLNIQSLE